MAGDSWEDDEANLREIQAAIEQAEIENFLTSQGISG